MPLAAQQNQWEWSRTAGTLGDQLSRAVATDPSGFVYATGYIENSNNNFSSTLISSAGNKDIFIAKYNSSGSLIWVKAAGSSGDDQGYDITTDPFGGIYVCGFFNGSATFYGTPNITLTSAGSKDIFLAKYNSSGNIVWAKRAGGSGNEDIAFGVSADSNNVYITGSFTSTASFGALPALSSSGGRDMFMASYNVSTGVENWAIKAGGSGDEEGHAVKSAGTDLFVTGTYKSDPFTFAGLTPSLQNDGSEDVFLAKFNTSGVPSWQKRMSGSDVEYSTDLAIFGNFVYMSGYFKNNSGFYNSTGGPSIVINASDKNDGFIAQYNRSTGNINWAVSESGDDEDYTRGVAVNILGDVYCVGEFKGFLPLGPLPGISSSNTDFYVTKYNSSGIIQWGIKSSGNNQDDGYGIAISSAGFGYVVGWSASDPVIFGSTSYPATSGYDIVLAKLMCNVAVMSITPAPSTICQGNTITLTASGGMGYSWAPGSSLSSATGTSVIASPVATTTYTLTGSSVDGCLSSPGTGTVNVQPPISNNVIAADQTICSGNAPAILTGTAPAGGSGTYTYLWQQSNDSITWTTASGTSTTATYTPPVLTSTKWYRRIVSSFTCSALTSVPVKITVQPPISNNTISSAQTICSGISPSTLTGTTPSGGDGSYTYLWEQSSDMIAWSPATGLNAGSTYSPPSLTDTTYYLLQVSSGMCTGSFSLNSNIVSINVLPSLVNNSISAPNHLLWRNSGNLNEHITCWWYRLIFIFMGANL